MNTVVEVPGRERIAAVCAPALPDFVANLTSREVELTFTERRLYSFGKRAFDLVVASIAALLVLPVLAVAVAAIRLEDRGPVLFTQKRVGRFGRLFTIFKLRTMTVEHCVDAMAPAVASDPRVTRVGRILRKTSIDELPQILNVLRGEMSIVGPRPELPLIVSRYAGWQHLRHLSKPGITGLWQVACRKRIPLHRPEATKIDIEYIRTASMLTDGRLVLRTFVALVSTSGAY